ncbi:MAG: hypothetical protein KDG51_16715, partial [Calditrichaeota bacterium]|nr:hypothetical protein [Calditrichota bacterium]
GEDAVAEVRLVVGCWMLDAGGWWLVVGGSTLCVEPTLRTLCVAAATAPDLLAGRFVNLSPP